MLELKAMIKDLPLSKKGEQETPLLGFVRMIRSQLADKARQQQILVSENHTRGHFIKIFQEDLLQQSTPKGSDYLGFGKHGARTYQEVLNMDHEYCRWIDRKTSSPLETREIFIVVKMQSVFQEPNLENNMTQERMTRRIRQLEEEKLFAKMQAAKELDKICKTPEQKVASSITVLEEQNLSLKEQVRKLTEQVLLLMTCS